jgi:hypothetical protein
MARLLRRALLCASASLFALSASAQLANFELCGASSYATSLAPVGTPVEAHFAWDVSQPGYPTTTGEANFYDVGAFTFTVGDHTVRSDRVWVVMRDGANSGDHIEVRGYEPVIDGTPFAQGYFVLALAATPGTNPFNALQLPATLDLADFDNPSYTSFQLYSGVVANDLLLDVDMQWLGHPEQRPGNNRRDCKVRGRG